MRAAVWFVIAIVGVIAFSIWQFTTPEGYWLTLWMRGDI